MLKSPPIDAAPIADAPLPSVEEAPAAVPVLVPEPLLPLPELPPLVLLEPELDEEEPDPSALYSSELVYAWQLLDAGVRAVHVRTGSCPSGGCVYVDTCPFVSV